MVETTEFQYFGPVEGAVVPRYGSRSFIGVRRDAEMGWVWDLDVIVPVPKSQVDQYQREYRRALADGHLKEYTKAEYEASQIARHGEPKQDEPAPAATPEKGDAQTRRQQGDKNKRKAKREAGSEKKRRKGAGKQED